MMPKRITPTVCCEGPVQNMQLCLLGCTTPLKHADNLRAAVYLNWTLDMMHAAYQ